MRQMLLVLFKIWIIEIDFTTILSFLIGIVLGAILICMVYVLVVLASLRNKKFIIKTEEDTLTATETKDMIAHSQKSFKDKGLRGETSRVGHCKNICTGLVYGIATRFYPKSKHPLLELSVDEAMMLTVYIENRIEEILNRRGIRLLKKIRVSSIVEFTQKTNKVVDSKAFKVTKEVNSTVSTIKKIVNVVNPAWWFRKLIIDKTLNIITDKLCLVVIAIVGEETYKIYSKTVFNKNVEIESNIDDILTSIDQDFMTASKEIKNNVEEQSPQLDILMTQEGYRMKSKAFVSNKDGGEYKSCFCEEFPFLTKNPAGNKSFLKYNREAS